MTNFHCVISNCKNTTYNKPLGITFHRCPTTNIMRNKWLSLLKDKCIVLNWEKSKICSQHFENKHFEHNSFDSRRKLKENAVPTIFPLQPENSSKIEQRDNVKFYKTLDKLSKSDLIIDVKGSVNKLTEPTDLLSYLDHDLKCKTDTPAETKLWVLIKKQDHLITKLMEQIAQNRKQVEVLQNNLDAATASKRDMEQNFEAMKYIVKSLQEKHATLEEQIEILTSVESLDET